MRTAPVCGLSVSNLFVISAFNFNLKLLDVTSPWRHHGSRRWRWQQKIFFLPENYSARRYT